MLLRSIAARKLRLSRNLKVTMVSIKKRPYFIKKRLKKVSNIKTKELFKVLIFAQPVIIDYFILF